MKPLGQTRSTSYKYRFYNGGTSKAGNCLETLTWESRQHNKNNNCIVPFFYSVLVDDYDLGTKKFHLHTNKDSSI